MGWSIGFDEKWQRDIGYGVPCVCDHPGCNEEIDRGLSYVCCDTEPYGGERGCGLYFCENHQRANARHTGLCDRCLNSKPPFKPKPDTLKWLYFKMTDPSWEGWRRENGLIPPEAREEMSLEDEAREWYNAHSQLEPTTFSVMAEFAMKKLEQAHREASIIEMGCNEHCHLEIAEKIRALMGAAKTTQEPQ